MYLPKKELYIMLTMNASGIRHDSLINHDSQMSANNIPSHNPEEKDEGEESDDYDGIEARLVTPSIWKH
jgi:hypothetical protein